MPSQVGSAERTPQCELRPLLCLSATATVARASLCPIPTLPLPRHFLVCSNSIRITQDRGLRLSLDLSLPQTRKKLCVVSLQWPFEVLNSFFKTVAGASLAPQGIGSEQRLACRKFPRDCSWDQHLGEGREESRSGQREQLGSPQS